MAGIMPPNIDPESIPDPKRERLLALREELVKEVGNAEKVADQLRRMLAKLEEDLAS